MNTNSPADIKPAALTRTSVRADGDGYAVDAEAVWIGNDLLVYIWGGEKPHIGAVAAAQPRTSLADASEKSATSSVLTYLGHKEDQVVKQVSEALAAALNCNVVVSAGIHWDDLDAEAIKTIGRRVTELIQLIIDKLLQEEDQK